MSADDDKLRTGRLPSLAPRKLEETLDSVVPWSLVEAQAGESCRWGCVDGRWVSLSIGTGAEAGQVVVLHSSGGREIVDSYEGALALARSWRTW